MLDIKQREYSMHHFDLVDGYEAVYDFDVNKDHALRFYCWKKTYIDFRYNPNHRNEYSKYLIINIYKDGKKILSKKLKNDDDFYNENNFEIQEGSIVEIRGIYDKPAFAQMMYSLNDYFGHIDEEGRINL